MLRLYSLCVVGPGLAMVPVETAQKMRRGRGGGRGLRLEEREGSKLAETEKG